MASGPLSCHMGAGEFGDGESLSGGDGVGDGVSLYGGGGVGGGGSALCPEATPVPAPAIASTATPVSRVILARLIMDTPWVKRPLPHPSGHTPRYEASLPLLTEVFGGLPQHGGTANRNDSITTLLSAGINRRLPLGVATV
jgi:hypothetical protein